jgi:hypothetical protein
MAMSWEASVGIGMMLDRGIERMDIRRRVKRVNVGIDEDVREGGGGFGEEMKV